MKKGRLRLHRRPRTLKFCTVPHADQEFLKLNNPLRALVFLESPFFWPYELLFLVSVTSVFFIIYKHFASSVALQKEVLLNKITVTSGKLKQDREGTLLLTNQPSTLPMDYKLQELAYSKGLDAVAEGKSVREASNLVANQFIRNNFGPDTSVWPKKDTVDELSYSYILEKLLSKVTGNKDKIRLSDLEKIVKNPEDVEIIYRKRLLNGR
jgi:hypothetical protein